MSLADSNHFVPLTATLLQAGPDDDASALAKAAHVPGPTAHRILRFYRYHGAVRKGRGPLHPDKRKVFQLATSLRRDAAVPDLVLRNGPEHTVLIAELQAARIQYVVGFASAANLLAYFEPAPFTTLFMRKRDAARAKSLARGRKGNDEIHIHYADLSSLETVGRDGIRITEPFRTLLDVGADVGTGAHAEFLYQALVEGRKP